VFLALFITSWAVAGGDQKQPAERVAQDRQGLNDITAENARTDGVVPRTRWDREGYLAEPGVGSVEGFSTQFSVAPGDTVQFKVKTPAGSTSYQYEIYRLGWYGGEGARQVWPTCDATPPDECPRITITDNPVQEACDRFVPADPGLDVPDCTNWLVGPDPNASWKIDASAVSGVYLARFSSVADPGDVSHVPFVVREAAASFRADVLYQLGDSTWQAYNNYNDGEPFQAQSYYDNSKQAVSYNRPWRNRAGGVLHGPKHFLFDLDLPLIRFLEANGISVGYMGSADLEGWPPEFPLKSSNPLFGRKAYLANGHEEYWPGRRLQNLKLAAASGTNMLFLCANAAYYKTRFVSDNTLMPGRVQIAYKEGRSQDDPRKNEPEWTGVYRDTRPNAWDPSVPPWTRPMSAPAGSSNSLTGVTPAAVNLVDEPGQPGNVPPMTVPKSMQGLRVWRNTNCAKAASGCTLGVANVGFEMDLRADRYFEPFVASQPAGLFSVAATVVNLTGDGLHADSGHGYAVLPFTDVADFTWPHVTVEATMYRNGAGALVFASSSFRWSHGLDDARSTGVDPSGVSPDMQQATINILADMNVQPGSLMPGLLAASASTDHTAPVSQITELNHATGVVTGVASDVDGVVAGVEISFDGGQTWHGTTLSLAGPATSWSHTTVVPANVNPLVRAVDDSGNLEVAHGPVSGIPQSDGLAVTTIGVLGRPSVSGILSQTTAPAPGGVRSLAPGWTSLVAMDMNGDGLTDLLSYNATTGAAIYEIAIADSPGMRVLVNNVTSVPGWTSIVPMNIHGEGGPDIADLLSYNAASGLAYYSVGVSPGVQEIVNTGTLPAEAGFHVAPGFTLIVPMNINGDALTDLLWYNSATGLAVYTKGVWHERFFDEHGAEHLAFYGQEVVAVRDAAPGWTSIVPMRMNGDSLTDLLSYNAATGLAVYSIGDGVSQTIVRTVNAAAGWTSIVPLDVNGDGLTDLLSYNAATGLAFYSVASGVGVQQVVGPPAHGAAWWTSIVPMKVTRDLVGTYGLTDLLFYR
jgi:hypothetical protein